MLARLALVSAALLSTAFTACEDPLPPGDISQPDYWGQYFLDKYEEERQVGALEPGPGALETPRTVLLITGVTIPAEWFEPIAARLERDGFRPVVYEPPDLLSGDLFESSHLLADEIERILAETGEDKLDILAECTGGLIARYYIQSLGGEERVSRMVTFISPQHGVDKAPIAYDLVGWPALDDLTPGSDFLEAVNGAPLPADVPFTSIYTCTDEYIQPYETSIIPGATNIEVCDGFVGHFQFFWDPALYLLMHGALTAPVPGGDDPGDDVPGDDDVIDVADDQAAGCSAGGGSAGAGAVLLLGALFATRRRRARN